MTLSRRILLLAAVAAVQAMHSRLEAVNLAKIAAITTISVNVLQAPVIWKKSKSVAKKSATVVVKVTKKVVGK